MPYISQYQIEAFIENCRLVTTLGLTQYSSGNLSWRFSDQLVAITASRSWLADLTQDEIVICRLDDGCVLNGKTPSVETVFHLGILRNRPDIDVVLHYQSAAATTLACRKLQDMNINFNVIPEIGAYIGTPAIVGYHLPGSDELAKEVINTMKNHNLAILQNHGQVVAGKGFKNTFQKAGFFELACQIILKDNLAAAIPDEDVQYLIKQKLA